MRLISARPEFPRSERGSGAAAVIIFAFLFLALAAFVVDGGLSISQRERAADIAEQAARYAAQKLDTDALRHDRTVIDTAACATRVRDFAERSGITGPDLANAVCTDTQPQKVTVRIQLTYRPTLTGFFYNGSLTVTGTATAEVVTGP